MINARLFIRGWQSPHNSYTVKVKDLVNIFNRLYSRLDTLMVLVRIRGAPKAYLMPSPFCSGIELYTLQKQYALTTFAALSPTYLLLPASEILTANPVRLVLHFYTIANVRLCNRYSIHICILITRSITRAVPRDIVLTQ